MAFFVEIEIPAAKVIYRLEANKGPLNRLMTCLECLLLFHSAFDHRNCVVRLWAGHEFQTDWLEQNIAARVTGRVREFVRRVNDWQTLFQDPKINSRT